MIILDNEYLTQALALIDTAKCSIDISTFKAEITSKPRGRRLAAYFDKLYDKKSQGVKIRFLINYNDDKRITPKSNLCAINYMKNHKLEVRCQPHNRTNHAKILLVDSEKAIIGSHNLSVASVHRNFEVSYLLLDPVNVAYLQAVYNRVWLTSMTL